MLSFSALKYSVLIASLVNSAQAQNLRGHLDYAGPGVSALSSADRINLERLRKELAEERALGQALYGPDCPDLVGKPTTVDQPTQLAKDVAKILEPALALTGRCPTKHKDLAEDLAGIMQSQVGRPPKIRIRKDNNEMATADDWVAVDLIARTLYGEVGGKPKCSDPKHLKAVGRVIMNRRDFMNHRESPDDEKRARYTKFFKVDSKVKNQVALAAINADEFHVWDPDKKDSVGRWMACPGTEPRAIKDKTGKQIGYITEKDVERWERAVAVASEMIFKEKKFRCDTKGVKGVFYSKGDYPPGKNFEKVGSSVRIDNEMLDGKNCVELWQNPRNRYEAEDPEDCAPSV